MKYSLNFLKRFVEINDYKDLFEKLTNVGFNLESYEVLDDDVIFDLEVTSNRPDVLSHFGIAREVSAIYGIEIKNEKVEEIPVLYNTGLFKIEIEDFNLCPRYSALYVENIKVAQSPIWLKKLIEAVGFRPINNIVDISNYVLASLGHPTHPFDFDTISDKTIIVRASKKGEKLKTLDGVLRTMEGGEILISDPRKPIGLAGIMGGEETEVKSSTKRVLFESAFFSPVSIRKTSKKLGIQTEASIRFGRGADIENTILALMAIAYFIKELGCGTLPNFILDVYPEKLVLSEIIFSIEKLNYFFGFKFEEDWVKKTLNSLGFKIKDKGKDWIISPPSYRGDVKEDVDIYEEVGRVYGYDKLPQKLPSFEFGRGWELDEIALTKKAQDLLSHFGLNETISYIFSKEEEVSNFDFFEKRKPAKLRNPLNLEEPFLRTSLIPGLLRTFKNNLSKNIRDVDIFEIGNVYYIENNLYREEEHCGILVSGKRGFGENSNWDFYYLKGIAESFIRGMGKKDYKFKFENLRGFYENGCSLIEIEKRNVGLLGEVKIEAPFPVWVFEISLIPFKESFKETPKFKPISNFPPIEIDMTIGHPIDFYFEKIISIIEEQKLPNLVSINFKDRFIKESKIFTTITLKFQSFERSLTQEEINKIREDLANYLLKNFPIKF